MGTSFAPSPTDSVTGVGFTPSLTRRTICAFCSGDTRHAMTTEQFCATARNRIFSCMSPKMTSSAAPVTIMAFSRLSKLLNLAASASTALATEAAVLSGARSSVAIVIPASRTLALKPIFLAVSSLSPVRTHRLIPASRSFSMVSGTPVCNLSSIAVTPTMSKSTSISSATRAKLPSRSSKDFWAAWYLSSQRRHSSCRSVRLPMTNVLRPSPAKFVKASSKLAPRFLLATDDLSSITLSAPFAKRKNSPPFWTTTDILLRAESNALTARIWYSISLEAPTSCATTIRSPTRDAKRQPSCATASTNALSSGLSAS
mmetsp:Transcript_124610/g.311654  ORF Transcript_124610/g.311654 Transcript_124610/m.311654 type:complete len:315 (+) Transcript_124610:2032-2976(+)